MAFDAILNLSSWGALCRRSVGQHKALMNDEPCSRLRHILTLHFCIIFEKHPVRQLCQDQSWQQDSEYARHINGEEAKKSLAPLPLAPPEELQRHQQTAHHLCYPSHHPFHTLHIH